MINTTDFQHQSVRDLAWVMSSPGLLSQSQDTYVGDKVSDEWCQQRYQQNLAWLQQLDADPEPLLQWLAQHESPLLGFYFESLISFWLQHLPQFELLSQNLSVGQPGLRVGEFDFLFRDKAQQQVIHWEVAVKFYLRYGERDFRWLGPNPRDTLQRKLNKVFSRQLLLQQKPQAQRLLQQTIGATEIKPQAFIKGYLFYPLSSDWQNPSEIPPGVSDDHLKGWWCRLHEVEGLLKQHGDERRWYLLPRLEWLAPVAKTSKQELLDGKGLLVYLQDYFANHYQAQLLVELERDETGWQEMSRGFVVNEHWPR